MGFPKGGPQAVCGETGDFLGTLQQIWAAMVGEMWGHKLMMPQLSGKTLGLCF